MKHPSFRLEWGPFLETCPEFSKSRGCTYPYPGPTPWDVGAPRWDYQDSRNMFLLGDFGAKLYIVSLLFSCHWLQISCSVNWIWQFEIWCPVWNLEDLGFFFSLLNFYLNVGSSVSREIEQLHSRNIYGASVNWDKYVGWGPRRAGWGRQPQPPQPLFPPSLYQRGVSPKA